MLCRRAVAVGYINEMSGELQVYAATQETSTIVCFELVEADHRTNLFNVSLPAL